MVVGGCWRDSVAEQEKHREAIAADPSAAQRLRLQERARAQSLLNRMFALALGLQVNNGPLCVVRATSNPPALEFASAADAGENGAATRRA